MSNTVFFTILINKENLLASSFMPTALIITDNNEYYEIVKNENKAYRNKPNCLE
jgi:hypothetical protein